MVDLLDNPSLLPLADFAGWLSTAAGVRWRLDHPPIAGADDDPPDPPADDPPVDDPADPPADLPDDPPEETDGERAARLLRDENAALKRKVAESEKAQRKAERERQVAEEKRRKDDGEFKTLYEESESRRLELEGSIKKKTLRAAITTAAGNLGFRNTADALARVTLNVDEVVDEDLEVDEGRIERALRELLKESPYLARSTKPQADDLAGKSRKRKLENAGVADEGGPANWNPQATLRSAYAADTSP